MSDYEGITGELRVKMQKWGWVTDGEVTLSVTPPSLDAEPFLTICGSDFDRLCDAIDSIHAQLERENAALKAELDRVLGEQDEHTYSIGSATVTVTPRLDWSAVAADLRELTALCERTKGR